MGGYLVGCSFTWWSSWETLGRLVLLKVITWRVLSFTICGLISWWYLGEFRRSLILTVILNVLMTTVHYFFEKLWEKLVLPTFPPK
tara:strand:- start:358 stop:615 length:258 start_codon:yes stop_codon:yes gene_type:complete